MYMLTLDEYEKTSKRMMFRKKVQKIMVDGSTPEETLEILNNLKERYEYRHKVTYTDESIQNCVSLGG